jgi:hypothetical protein
VSTFRAVTSGRPLTQQERDAATQLVRRQVTNAGDAQLLLEALGLAGRVPEHGTHARYLSGCRCEDCREANRVRCLEYRRRAAADPAIADRAGHGRASTYKNLGCRCTPCREASMAHQAKARAARRARQKAAAGADRPHTPSEVAS